MVRAVGDVDGAARPPVAARPVLTRAARPRVALTLAGLLFLAACGGGHSSAASSTTTTTVETPRRAPAEVARLVAAGTGRIGPLATAIFNACAQSLQQKTTKNCDAASTATRIDDTRHAVDDFAGRLRRVAVVTPLESLYRRTVRALGTYSAKLSDLASCIRGHADADLQAACADQVAGASSALNGLYVTAAGWTAWG